jgi:transcriptional regulator
MYLPPAFRDDELPSLHQSMRHARLANFVTATTEGLIGTPLPLLLAADEGPYGTLYGHVARANSQWQHAPVGEAMAMFMGPDAYVSPSFYPSKAEHHRHVPTWNYISVHAYGPVEFFDDASRLLDVVSRLTSLHENGRKEPWAVTDAPEEFIAAQLRGIVGIRLPITRIDGKRKMSQNRSAEDRAGVVSGLTASDRASDRIVAALIPK